MPAVVAAYLIAATVVMPVYGKLGDRSGRRPLLVAGIGVFTLGAVLGTLARSPAELLTFRAIQGAGSGGLVIGAQAVIGETVSLLARAAVLRFLRLPAPRSTAPIDYAGALSLGATVVADPVHPRSSDLPLETCPGGSFSPWTP
jgi:MFS family permease